MKCMDRSALLNKECMRCFTVSSGANLKEYAYGVKLTSIDVSEGVESEPMKKNRARYILRWATESH